MAVVHDGGIAGVYVSHDLAVVAQIADRIVVSSPPLARARRERLPLAPDRSRTDPARRSSYRFASAIAGN
jgi:ABC-type nitrate/sulfonate/bicarbonate transport system ATPase subunit